MFLLPASRSPGEVAGLIHRWLPRSRFTIGRFDYERVGGTRTRRVPRGSVALRLREIRLRVAKPYCGQHPGACPLRGRKHHDHRFLEGADWVAFDDMLNDILDRASIEADIWQKGLEFSSRYFIRVGRLRRTDYPAIIVDGRAVWDCAHSHGGWSAAHFGIRRDDRRSEFPPGTPGVPRWRSRGPKHTIARAE